MSSSDVRATSGTSPAFKSIGAGSGALLNGLQFGITVLVTFILAPYMLRRLGDASYGLLSVTWELGGYFGLFDLGLRSAINYYVSRSVAAGAVHDVRAVVRTAFWLLFALTVTGLLVSWPLAMLTVGFIRKGPLDPGTVRSILWLGLIVFSLNLTGGLASAVLAGLRRFDWLVATNLAGTVAAGLLVFAAIEAGMGLFSVAFAQAVGTMLPWIAQQWILHRWKLASGFWPPRLDRSLITKLTSYGGANLLMRVSELLAFQADQIIIVQAAGPAAVAQYHVGRYIALHSRSLVSVLCMVQAPYFTALSVAGRQEDTQALLLRLNRWICALAFLLLAGVLCLGEPFLALWVGARYVAGDWWSRSDVVLVFFACAMAFRALSSVPYQYLLGTRRLRFVTFVLGIEALAILGGSVVAIRWKGIAAVALVKLITSFLTSVVALVPYTLREAGVGVSDYLRMSLLPALFTGAATAAVAGLLRFWMPVSTWPQLLLCASASAAAGAGAFLLFSTAEDREFMLRKLRTPLG
ncbi:MAG: oligosaccharide flippase family protein [Acidobacteriota bacterium]